MKIGEYFVIVNFFVKKTKKKITTMLQIHERILKARLDAGFTQDEMAEKLKIPRTTYRYWEEKTPSLSKIQAVERVLGLPKGHFLAMHDEKPEAKTVEKVENANTGVSFEEHLEAIREQKRMADEHRKSAEKHAEDLKQIIISQLTGIDQKLGGVTESLKTASGGLFEQSLRIDAVSVTALESLARLEKKKPDFLIDLADKRQQERFEKLMQQGKRDGVSK